MILEAAKDVLLDGQVLWTKGERRETDDPEEIAKLRSQGFVDAGTIEPGVREAVDSVFREGLDFSDPTGQHSTPVYVAKAAVQGAASSLAHGVAGLEKGAVGGVLDLASAGARVLGNGAAADQLQDLKRGNEALVDRGTRAVDDFVLGEAFDNSREAWEKVMGVSEGLGHIAGGVAAAKPLAAGLKAAKVAKTAKGAMKAAFTAQMAAGGEEAARTAILTKKDEQGNPVVDENGQPVIENRDLTWRERAEVAYHTAKEAITAQFFGRVVGAWGGKIGNAGAAALEFGGINAAGVLADAYIGDNIAGREWKDENGNVLVGSEKGMAVLQKMGAEFLYGGMQSLLMSMGGAIAGTEKRLAENRRKAVKDAMERPKVVAVGANGERVLEGGALVRVAEDGAPEMVTPYGVVLDAEGKVKTVTAGNVGETGEGAYGTDVKVRVDPLTGRPTAARETVRNALIALQEGVTIDQLRESDGWTPENKAVFETVARLKQGLAEGMPAGELVDALAGLGIGERDARAFGFIPEGNRYVGDALAVANNGTRSLQNAVGNGGPGHIPLEIAAEVARSVNAGTTGLMPKELAKRQLETARQLIAERAKAKLEESAAEHGNTPEAERAVLDTPVEKPDGTLTTLGEMAEGSAQSQEEPAERGLNIGDEKGIYTTKVDTQNPKTPDGKNTVIFRRRPEESMRLTEEAQVIEANEEALPQGVELGDKDTPYTPEERQRVRAFTKERAREQRGEVQNADFGRIVIGRDFVNEVTRHALSTRREVIAVSHAREIASTMTHFAASPNEEIGSRTGISRLEYGLAKLRIGEDMYLVMGEVGIRNDGRPYYDQRVVAKLKADSASILRDGIETESAFDKIYDNRFRILLQAARESAGKVGESGQPPPGTTTTLRARHEREQSVRALGIKPLGDGSYGVGRFPQMRVEKADGLADDTGMPVKALRVTGLDPAEMLRPENILDAARVLGDLMEKCAAKGVRVDFEPEAVDAVKEVMAKWETDVRTDPVLRARSEVVTSLLEKSGLASGIVTDQAGFEAALREKGGAQAEKLIVDGQTYGFVDPASGTVYLNPAFFGTKQGLNTPIHEFGHLGIVACRKINRPLYDRGVDLIKQTKYWKEVVEHPDYKNDSPEKNAEEALTRLIADRGEKLSAETPKGVLNEIKQWLVDFWKTFGNALGLREITPEQVEKMTVEQIADAIRAEMLRGERFGTTRRQVEARQQAGRRLRARAGRRSPAAYVEAGGGKASAAFMFWAENGRRIMNVPKPGEFGWDLYNQLVLGQKDPAERARMKRLLCGDQPKNTRRKGNDEILAEFNRDFGGEGDVYALESGFQQMVEEFLSSHADYERWRAEGAKSIEEMHEEAEAEHSGRRPPEVESRQSNVSSFDPAELEEWGRMYDELHLEMSEAGLDEPDSSLPAAAFSRGGVRRKRAGTIVQRVPRSERRAFHGEFNKAMADYAHNNNGETPKTCGVFTREAYYVFDIIDGEPINIHRIKADGRNREKIKELDKKYKAEIYKGTRDSAYWFDRIGHELSEHLQAGNGNQNRGAGARSGNLDLRASESAQRRVPDAGRDNAPGEREALVAGGGSGDIRYSIGGVKGASQMGIKGAGDAEAMEKAGKDREEIWRTTGWWRGKDGKWRFELPSTKMKDARALYAALVEGHNETTLGKILDAPKLFEAYPQLKDTKIVLSSDTVNPGEAGGWYDRIKNEIVLFDTGLVSLKDMPFHERDLRDTYQKVLDSDEFVRRRLADMDAFGIEHGTVEEEREYARWWINRQDKKIDRTNETRIRDLENNRGMWSAFGKIIHEVQHAVQRIEGFASGASGEEDGYSRFGGEVEARNASRREAMSPEERAATPPWATEDVPEDRQIIRFSRGQMSALAKSKVGGWVEGTSSDGVRNAIEQKIEKGLPEGEYRFKKPGDRARLVKGAVKFYKRFAQKTVMLSDGRCAYFVPDERARARGLSNEEAWAEYAIHAVTSSGQKLEGKEYAERLYNATKAQNIWRIENILKAERCEAKIDDNPERDAVIFFGRGVDGKIVQVITRLDERGNIYADLAEVTMLNGGKMKKLPPRKPLTEVVEAVANRRQRGGLLTADAHSIHDPGSPVKAQAAKISSQTETLQFKEFFGDAKKDPANASKVVDENGEPLVVYHGTEKNFWAFSDQQIGSHTDAGHDGGVGLWGRGHYFTSDRSEAEGYVRGNPDGRTMAVYLNIRNPMGREELVRIGEEAARITEDRPEDFYREYQRLIDESVRQNGYDGAIVKHRNSTEYVVFDPAQVKSATDNIGTFDPGNPDIRFSRGGYKPGDWRKTFTFGKAARGAAEQTNGGLAAGEERRRWEENPVDERIPEWDAPQRNPNIAKPFALSSAEGVRLVKLLGGTMKKPKAYKDAIGVIDESDEQRIRDDLKAMGFFKGDDFLWAATATPAEVAADRADSQAALDARLEKLGEQRLKGEAGGGNRGLVRVSMSQVADLVLSLPAETGGNLGNVRTLAQGIVRGFEKDRTPEQAAYYFEEARNLLDWFYGRAAEPPRSAGTTETSGTGARPNPRKLLARAFGAFLEAPDAVAERAPGLYREFVDAISRNDKLLHAFDAIRRTALGEGSAERVYAEIEAGRTARAEEAARRLKDEVEKPIGSRLERAKDSFVYNFDDMHGPIFMHITRAQKRQLAELKASLKAGRITQADYDAATAAFRQAVQGLKIAELKVDRGTQNEIRQYLWDYVYQLYDAAKREGVDPGDLHRYRDLRWIVASGGRAGSHGMSARDAQIVLDNMKRHMGDEAFARLDGVARRIHAVREKNILDDPRCLQMMGQARVNYYKNNAYYVRTERTRATPEELAQIERDRAAYRREHGDADDVIDAMLKFIDGTGNVGRSGYDTWSHELLGSEKGSKDRDYATCKNDVRIMIAMERNDFVIKMRDALLNAKAVGVYDLPAGSGRAKYPQNARYGHIRYFENGRQRVLVVPRVLADGYRQVSDAMTGWSAWGKIAHGVFIDWNLAYTLRNMTRNMASNESNIVGMRADNATILGNAIAPGAGRAASMAAYQIARHLPSAVFRHPLARAAFGEHVNAAYAGQAQRILELYLDPRKAVERRAAAEEARLRGETGPAMELDADLELMRFMTKSGALIARWDEVHGAGRDADLFMQGHGLGPIYGEKGPSAPTSRAHKILATTGKVLSYPFRRNAQFNRDLELHAKITAALAIHEMQPGLTAEQVGIEVARRASIPWGERQGRMSRFINYAWNMFFNTALKGGQRFVGNVVRNPRLLGKMAAQSLGPQLFWATMIAGGGLAAVIRSMFGGGDDAEEKARRAGLGWLLDYTQFMHDGTFAAAPYLQRFYHWCPLGKVGERYIGIATPRTDEEKMLLPFVDWVAAKLAPQPTDPTATLGDAVKRGVVGTFVPDLTARTPLVAAAQDLVFAWWQNPMDTYRGAHVYDNSLWQARGESVGDAAAFAWATAKQGFNDLGGRTIVRPRRNEIEVAEGSGAQPPSFAEKAWDFALNDIPVLSGVLGGSLRMTLTKEQRLDQVERELLAPIRAVKNRRSEEIMKMMLESPVANNGSETPEIKEKLDAWAQRYGWDEAERGNVFARAFNGYQAATAAGQELAAQRKEANRQKRWSAWPASERRAMEAAGLAVIQSE